MKNSNVGGCFGEAECVRAGDGGGVRSRRRTSFSTGRGELGAAAHGWVVVDKARDCRDIEMEMKSCPWGCEGKQRAQSAA